MLVGSGTAGRRWVEFKSVHELIGVGKAKETQIGAITDRVVVIYLAEGSDKERVVSRIKTQPA